MASRPCVQRRGIYCSHLTRWNGSLILLFGSFTSPFGSPAGRHSKGTAPRVSHGSNLVLSRRRGSSGCMYVCSFVSDE